MNNIPTTEELIKGYAMLISQDEDRGRTELHHLLCQALSIPHSDLKPFEDNKRIPTYPQAVNMIRLSIKFYKPKQKELLNTKAQLHCGCCQIPFDNMEELNKHFLTPEHNRNAIEAMDEKLSDLHAKRFVEEYDRGAESGEPVEFNIWLVYWKLRKQSEILLSLSEIVTEIKESITDSQIT